MITPACRLGGSCTLVSRDDAYGSMSAGSAGFAQCTRCSIVYEATGWRPRKCDYCGMEYGESPHDPCLGYIAGVSSACCGHGDPSRRHGVD